MIKLDLEKAAEPEIKLPTSVGSSKKQANSGGKKMSTSTFLTMPKPLTMWITKKLENSSRDRNARPPYLLPEKSVNRSRSNRTGHGATDWFQIGK